MFTSRILRTDAELTDFAKCYLVVSDLAVQLEYLRRGKVRAFYRDGRMAGGYVLNSSAPFRYLSNWFVTDEHRRSEKLPPLEEMVEGTCIWFDRSVGTGERSWAYLWLTFDFFASGKKYFLGGTLHEGVRRMQMIALPHHVFAIHFVDPKTGQPGLNHVYYGTRWSGATALPRWILARMRKSAKHRIEARAREMALPAALDSHASAPASI